MHLGVVGLMPQGLLVVVRSPLASVPGGPGSSRGFARFGRVGPVFVCAEEPLHGLVKLALVREHDPQVHPGVEGVGLESRVPAGS